MDILTQSNIKAIKRVTGTPENFLTALRFMVWGFNKENKGHWEKLLPGDIIFFHSKGSDSKFIKSPRSSVIGFGVVGNNFYEDYNPLWIDEKLDNSRSYPYRFSFSEFYLFVSIPINDDWDSTSLNKFDNTRQIISKILDSTIPLSDLEGFPYMGSFSSINDSEIKRFLLNSTKKLAYYEGDQNSDIFTKTTELKSINNEAEALRYGTTLTIFDNIKERILSESGTTYGRNIESLAKAEKSHYNIVSQLMLLFAKKGYQLFSNPHVDLFAYKNNYSVLVEAKSIENLNFKNQSRKGIIQLFEYNYFEVSKFKKDKNLSFSNEVSLLATSDEPKDVEYIKFINSLDIHTIAVKHAQIVGYGRSINIHNL